MKKLILLLLVPAITLGQIVDLREYQTPVRDQLDRNTCAYFAATAALESIVSVQFGKKYDFS